MHPINRRENVALVIIQPKSTGKKSSESEKGNNCLLLHVLNVDGCTYVCVLCRA